MKRNLKLIKILASIIIIISGFYCSRKNTNPVGSEFYANANIGSEHFVTLYAAASDTFYQEPVSLADSPYLYVGRNQDISAECILRFPTIDTVGALDSARIVILVRDIQDEDGYPAEIRVRKVTQAWDEEIENDAFSEAMIGDDIFTFTDVDTTTDSLIIPIDVDLIAQWSDTTADANFGIHLSSPSAVMTQFYAYESGSQSVIPQLWLYFSADTANAAYTLTYAQDVSFTATAFEPTPDRLIIEDGTGLRSLIQFDFSQIPKTAAINKATLKLQADTLSTFSNAGLENGFKLYALTDSLWTFMEMPYDSLFEETGHLFDDVAEINITKLLQLMVSEYTDGETLLKNSGFILTGAAETAQITRSVFHSTTADSSRQPQLDIFYSIPPR